jgi:hypothetical protein
MPVLSRVAASLVRYDTLDFARYFAISRAGVTLKYRRRKNKAQKKPRVKRG